MLAAKPLGGQAGTGHPAGVESGLPAGAGGKSGWCGKIEYFRRSAANCPQ
jgi:hypothetical protein